jgi:site-specific DNA-methyltransferase (adenine-specific)
LAKGQEKESLREEFAREGEAIELPAEEITINVGDFRELGRDIQDNSIDLIFTDPNYSFDYIDCWEPLGQLAARVLKPGRFLVTYTGNSYLPSVIEGLGKHMAYYWIGARYFKCSSGRAWSQHVWHGWKPILIYRKQPSYSDGYECPWFRDVVEEGGPEQAKVLHDYGQAIEDALYFIRVFTRPGDVVLDTFCGSGTTLVAAKELKRKAIGFEVDPKTANIARARLAHETPDSVDLNENELAECDPALAAMLEGILNPFITNTISNIFRGWDGKAVETSRQPENPLIERHSISEWGVTSR